MLFSFFVIQVVMKAFVFALCVVVCATVAATEVKHGEQKYVGSQVFRVTPNSFSEVQYLKLLQRSTKYEFWTEPSMAGQHVDILVSRWLLTVLKKTLDHAHISYDVIVPDFYANLVKSRLMNEIARHQTRQQGTKMGWTAYHDYDEIMDWAESLATTYPDLVSVEDVGTSYEGRTMKIVKVSTGGSGKPAIFSDAGIHAREWISPAVLTYIMNELLSNRDQYQDVLSAVDFYFMPSINPDGYSYTWTGDRMWRKTRSPTNSAYGCIGADPNRNWDFYWMESGASASPCSDIYAGPVAFSEVEMRNVRDQILKYSSSTQVYLTFHSYGQYMLYPWGYDESLPEDWKDLDSLAGAATDALTAVHGTRYRYGSSGTLLYPAAGASDDYSKGVGGIKYSYTVEMRDTGRYGFDLPPNQITPTGEETFELFKVIMNFVRDTYGK